MRDVHGYPESGAWAMATSINVDGHTTAHVTLSKKRQSLTNLLEVGPVLCVLVCRFESLDRCPQAQPALAPA